MKQAVKDHSKEHNTFIFKSVEVQHVCQSKAKKGSSRICGVSLQIKM